MKEPLRIVLCYPVEPQHLRQIQAAAPNAEVVNAGQERVNKELPDADIFIGHAKVPVDWQRVVRGGRLRWIQSSAAGLDHCLVPEVIDSDILVSSAAGLFAPQVAEQTLALLLGLLRSFPAFWRAGQRREFVRLPTDDLRGKTVGIVGMGGNGRRIADCLKPFGVRILATDFHPMDCPSSVDQLWPADHLPQLLGQAEIVILALPLNTQTQGLFDAEMFDRMLAGSYLINVARGAIVVETALIQALQSGRLRGAGLDVTEIEPLSPSSPLWNQANVIVTPHVGAQSFRRVADTTDLVCENLDRYLAGKKPWNVVDKRIGFAPPTGTWRPAD